MSLHPIRKDDKLLALVIQTRELPGLRRNTVAVAISAAIGMLMIYIWSLFTEMDPLSNKAHEILLPEGVLLSVLVLSATQYLWIDHSYDALLQAAWEESGRSNRLTCNCNKGSTLQPSAKYLKVDITPHNMDSAQVIFKCVACTAPLAMQDIRRKGLNNNPEDDVNLPW